MSDEQRWTFPTEVQPRADETQFDLSRAQDAVVLLRSTFPEDSMTASTLGTERGGYGVVINESGLVLTVGYLINEASQIWLTTNRGQVIEAHPLAFDQPTGFGLVQPLGNLDAPYLQRGSVADVNAGDAAFVIGHGGVAHSLKTRVIGKQEFAGYWEYVLDEALFTAPAHPQWGGAALLDPLGDLIGIGSLLVQQEVNGENIHVNMFIPIDLLTPILDSLLKTGRGPNPPRPWLGMYTQNPDGKLVVGRLTAGGPAERAGVKVGDMVLGVGEQRVKDLAALFRSIWKLGPAGVKVPLMIARSGDVLRIAVESGDRNNFLRKPRLQ